MAKKKENSIWQGYIYLLFFAAVMAAIFFIYPDKALPSLQVSWSSLSQFLIIFPAIILLIGIFAVLATPEMVMKNFGQGSGLPGALKALFFGSLMSTGPFYLSFPMAKTLVDKGATVTSIIIFVSAWNGVGVIAEIIEFHFLGPLFTIIRFSLTAIFIVIFGYAAQFITDRFFKKKALL
ncbi:MAG: hypothetical protein WCT16_04460 [Candidatus Buchananbacteria bacterium]